MSEQEQNISYINANGSNAPSEFADAFYSCLQNVCKNRTHIIVLCIGTDRVTGDCLGPITGYKLRESLGSLSGVHILGTLDTPVHAKNLEETLEFIQKSYAEPFIIAIDAGLGCPQHVGYLTVGQGKLLPGAGINKDLPPVGDMFITGIVNFSGSLNFMVLQNTRLCIVMKMAEVIHRGLLHGFQKFAKTG